MNKTITNNKDINCGKSCSRFCTHLKAWMKQETKTQKIKKHNQRIGQALITNARITRKITSIPMSIMGKRPTKVTEA
uniref:Uncharacterized protein n=1 Tax=Rhizophora mucronata TaxID=61149 RepID=A0A2P2PXJ5_RHIMU